MKFDFIIGNPPYQEDVASQGDRANPVYDKFMDCSYEISDCVELIHPARFLFDAGQTPKVWNKKMLQDNHLKVLYYEPVSSKVFSNTLIKGGIAITIHDKTKDYGAIETFTPFSIMNDIVRKINSKVDIHNRLNTIIASQGLYRFSNALFVDFPGASAAMGKGTGSKIVSSVIEKLPEIFLNEPLNNDEYVRFLGRIKGKRVWKWIKRSYLVENQYLDAYNLFIPEANNAGRFGEVLTEASMGKPKEGASDTFLSAGIFQTEQEATNLSLYMKTKFFRALLGTKKVTQHCPPPVWAMIPLQDFTPASDIGWSQSIHDIDQQLYKKYGLTPEEIDFIETHVKEME